MVVAVHNPANLAMDYVQIAVPHGFFAVQSLVDGVMQNAEATVLCNQQKDESTERMVENCQMYVKHQVTAGQVSFITLTSDLTTNLAVSAESVTEQVVSIESEELVLTYDSSKTMVEGGVLFTLTDKVTGESNPIGFSLRYWSGY